MNGPQLKKLGVPDPCVKPAVNAIRLLSQQQRLTKPQMRQQVRSVVQDPEHFVAEPIWRPFAQALLAHAQTPQPRQVPYQTWGASGIDSQTHAQMQQACCLPVAVRGALMADAHVGYGLPIGGVLACENAVVPYAVGVDIACRMKLSILDLPSGVINSQADQMERALQQGTRFGVGASHEKPQSHVVMDADWSVSPVTRQFKDRAWRQLGTSGSGNHFVEFGIVQLNDAPGKLGLEPGEYLGLLSHSGSRGTGAAVCNRYSQIARSRLPPGYQDFRNLAWLDLDSDAGQEYWAAMNLMGDYAAANHDVIHRLVCQLAGARIIGGIENHHNFAWIEEHAGRQLVVHRKGATPAGKGALGMIPGTMADLAYIVAGLDHPDALASASHGAGRQMSRKQAKNTYRWNRVRNDLAKRGVRVLSADADEVPGAYKDIHEVMRRQADLVETLGTFQPRIVKMCGDGSRAED